MTLEFSSIVEDHPDWRLALRMPTRSAVFGFLLFLFALSAFAQQGGQVKENLYSKALFASIAEMDKEYGRVDDSNGGERVRTDYRHMPVERDPAITDGLPEQFDQYRVEYLDVRQQVTRCKQLRKPFAILKIQPMTSDGARRRIQVTVYWAEYKKSRLSLGLSDWSDVEFQFDDDKQGFVVSSVKLGGI